MKAVSACLNVSWLKLVVNLEKLKLKKLPDPSKDFVGSGFCMYASEMVEISPGATVKCGVVHVPVPKNELCFVNAKVGLGFTFNLFEESNKDGIINSLSIANKSDMPITIQRGQHVGSLYLVETVEIPGNVLSSSLSSSLNLLNKLSSSYFFVSNSFDFSSLFSSFCEFEQERWLYFLEKWRTVLLLNKYNVGLTDVDYKIRLNDPTPIKLYIPCYSQGVREAILKELDKMKEADFIEPSISPFAAPMVCV